MRLYLDTRERILGEVLDGNGIPFTSKPLDIGDIDIIGPIGQRFLLERKTLSDLAASLRDGRFKSQKDRLLGVLQRESSTAVAYVLEGYLGDNDLRRVNGRVTVGTLRSLLNTIQLRYRIPVITTRNIKETATLIGSICKQLENKPEFCPVGSGGNSGCAGHADVMPQISKNTRDDPGSIWTSMLTAVRGVSRKTSSGIISHFETITPGGIIQYMREHTKEAFSSVLCEIRMNKRRIPKKIITKLVELFYPDTSTATESNDVSDSNVRVPYHPGIQDMYVRSPSPEHIEN